MSRRHQLFSGLFLLVCGAFSGVLRAETITVYGDEAYAPVIYLDHGKPAGVLPAIFARLSKDTGDRYELVLVPWKRALYESQRGLGGVTNISWNKERSAIYDFSDPIYFDDIQLVVLKGKEFPFNDLKDLKGKKVGGADGASYGEEVDKAIAAGTITMDRDPNQLSRMRKLLLGRMDVAIVGNGRAGFERLLASAPDLAANRDKFVVLPKPLSTDPLYLAFAKSKKMQLVLARFNKALASLKKTDEYRQLVEN